MSFGRDEGDVQPVTAALPADGIPAHAEILVETCAVRYGESIIDEPLRCLCSRELILLCSPKMKEGKQARTLHLLLAIDLASRSKLLDIHDAEVMTLWISSFAWRSAFVRQIPHSFMLANRRRILDLSESQIARQVRRMDRLRLFEVFVECGEKL